MKCDFMMCIHNDSKIPETKGTCNCKDEIHLRWFAIESADGDEIEGMECSCYEWDKSKEV